MTRKFDDLKAHSTITVYFEIGLQGSWDGNSRTNGPDSFTLQVGNGPTLVNEFLKANKGRYRIRRSFKHTGSSLTLPFSSRVTDPGDEKWSLLNLNVAADAGSAWITNSYIEPSYKFQNNKRVKIPYGAVQEKSVHTAAKWWPGGKKWIHGPLTFQIHRSDSSWNKVYNWKVPPVVGDGGKADNSDEVGNGDVTDPQAYTPGDARTSFPVTHKVTAQGTPAANRADMTIIYHQPFESEKVKVIKENFYKSGKVLSHDIGKDGVGATTAGPFTATTAHSGYTLSSPYGGLKTLSVGAGIIGTGVSVVPGGATVGAGISIAAAVGSYMINDGVPASAKFEFYNNRTLFERSLNADKKLGKVNFVMPERLAKLARSNIKAYWPKTVLKNVNYRQFYQQNKHTGKFFNQHGYVKYGSVTEELPVNKVAMGYYFIGATGVASAPDNDTLLAVLATP